MVGSGAGGRPGRVLVLANRRSRRGGDTLAPALERFEAAGIPYSVEATSSPGEVGADIVRRAPEVDAIVVAGGDGTLNAAAPGIVATGLPMGILPMGTANDLARTLGVPADLGAAADIVIAGHRRRIDLGYVNDCPFFNVATIGLGVDLADELNATGLKRRWGRLGYAIAGLRVLLSARPFSARIEAEDGSGQRVRTYQIAIGNGVHYGGGSVVEADAAIDDAALDLYSLGATNVWKLALMLRTFRSGRHGAWDEVVTDKGTRFTVRTRRPRRVNADGEIVSETPARFRVEAKAVEVFASQPAED